MSASQTDSYEMPERGWTCFHCGETFTTVGAARTHFGAQPNAVPGCLLKVGIGAERGLLMALRKVEQELANLYRERGEDDTPLHRHLYALQGRHADDLQTAEEAGYERGLAAGTSEGARRGKYHDVLAPFVALMEAELHANAGKGDRPGWLTMDRNTAMLEIYHHAAKLAKGVRDDDQARIREHAADVANMAMMLLDVCGGLPVGDHA